MNATGDSADSDASDAAQPATASLTASSQTADAATLTLAGWGSAWWLKRTTPADTTCKSKGTTLTESLTSLDSNKNYTYKAYSDSTCTTEVVSGSFLTKPAKPDKPAAAKAGSQKLLVTSSVSGDGTITHWEIAQKLSTDLTFGSWSDLTGQTTTSLSHTVSGLDNTKSYNFKVRAVNATGDSADSDASDAAQPSPVTLDASSVTHNSATLTIGNWTGNWYHKRTTPTTPTPNCSSVVSAPTKTADLTNLDSNTDYTYTAYSDSSCSTELASRSFLTKPGQPSTPTVTAGSGSGKLTLTASVTGNGTLSNWQYKQKEGNNSFDADWTGLSVTTTSLSHTITGLTDDTNYQFKVRAVNATGGSAESEASAAVAPTDETLTVTNIGATGATLNLGNYGSDWYYKHTVPSTGPGASCSSTAVTGNTKTVSGLTANTAYTYNAYSDSGCNTELAAAAPFPTLPPKPSTPTVTAGSGSGELSLSATVDGGSADITGWQYKKKDSAWDSNWTDISVTSKTMTHTVTGLTNSTDYQFKVRAVNASGSSEESEASTAVAPQDESLTVTNISETSATLNLHNYSGDWYYKYTKPTTPAGTCSSVVPAGTSTADLSSLSPGTEYTFKAYSDSSCSTVVATATDFTTLVARRNRTPDVMDTPLSASFHDLPAEHDGSDAFTFELRFSEDLPGLRSETLRDEAFRVTDGQIRAAERMAQGRRWKITLQPASFNDVVVKLPATTDCTAAGAICTGSGRRLSNSVTATVQGPILVTITDASATEGEDTEITFQVGLSRAPSAEVTVDYATADGTATAGEDYQETSGTLTFAAGEVVATVAVPVLDDGHDEGKETFTLNLSNARGARILDGEARGMIRDSDRMPQAWLARFGRTIAEQVVTGVESRLKAPRKAGVEVVLGGQTVGADNIDKQKEARREAERLARWLTGDDVHDGTYSMTAQEMLTQSAFRVTQAPAGGASVAYWGQGAMSSFDGQEGAFRVDGEVRSATLGADYASDDWLAGLMVSHGWGEGSYTGGGGSGKVTSSLTGFYPYFGITVGGGVRLWATAGLGEGSLRLTPKGVGLMESDMALAMGAVGAKGALVEPVDDSGFSLDLLADAMAVRTRSDAVPGLLGSRADTSRVRIGLEGGYAFALEDGGSLHPTMELVLRHDSGDAETGYGAEIGSGLKWTDPTEGFTAEFSVRGLLSHEAEGFRDRSVSGSLEWDPDPSSKRGPSLTMTQTLGSSTAGGLDALVVQDSKTTLGASDDDLENRRLDIKLGYGFGAFGGRFTATPELAVGLANDSQEYGLGWRLGRAGSGSGAFELKLEATRLEHDADDAAPKHGVRLDLNMRF